MKLRTGARPKAVLHPSRLEDLGRRGGRRKRRGVEVHGRVNSDACSVNGLEERCCNISSERWKVDGNRYGSAGGDGRLRPTAEVGPDKYGWADEGRTRVTAGWGRDERQRWPGISKKGD